MKRILIAISCFAAAMALCSCDGKNCRCYEFNNGRWTGPNTTYAASDTRCASLNTRTLQCIEMDEPIIDPSDIGVDTKKK